MRVLFVCSLGMSSAVAVKALEKEADLKEKLEDNIAYAVAEADLLEVVQGHINKD